MAGDALDAQDGAVADEKPPRGTGAALYAFAIVIFIGLPGPLATLIIWWQRRDEPFIDLHGRQALDLFLTGLVGLVIYFIGRFLEPVQATLAGGVQWIGWITVALQGIQGVWGIIDAARGGDKRMMVSLNLLRRRGAWVAA